MSQLIEIQRHLAKGHRLTPLEAFRRFGCMRLGARAYELRQLGWPVKKETVCVGNGKRVASYYFPKARARK